MIKVAITGNIASGKSFVQSYLSEMGYKVFDSDEINHFLLKNDIEVINEIKELFSFYDILDSEGKLSRDKIGKIVFSDSDLKKKLEEILHKRILKKTQDLIAQNSSKKIVFISVPLLFESKIENKFDKIIFISADESIRLKRLMKRNLYNREYAEKRIKAQDCEEEKIKKSDFVIYNNSDFDSLKLQIDDVLKKLINQ